MLSFGLGSSVRWVDAFGCRDLVCDDVDAFLMDGTLDVSEFFTSKFKLLVGYADHTVAV